MTKVSLGWLVALGLLAGIGSSAEAGCWVVWQGIKSHVECDSAGIKPTFEDFKASINSYAKASPACKRSVIKFAKTYFGCAMAVGEGIISGGAMVWVGAGEACVEFSDELKVAGRDCQEYVNLRTKPVTAKVCNGRPEGISVAIARREVLDTKVTTGWFLLKQGECKSFTYHNARVIYAMALAGGRRWWPDFKTGDLDDNATFCINRHYKHNDLNVETCHKASFHNPYDYDKPGDLKFTTFGRVSGLPNGHTFR